MTEFRHFMAILLLLSSNLLQAQQSRTVQIKGIVLDEQSTPIQLASVMCQETSGSALTDNKGNFTLTVPDYLDEVTIKVSYVGMKSVQLSVETKKQHNIVCKMESNSLTLKEITVNSTYTTNKNSISSIEFNEEAIERVQAFSLMDVLNTLPGKQMTPPNINAPQTLTLRNTLGGQYDLNNSLGIPIIVDGVTLSNDANMQSRPVGQRGIGGSALPAVTSGNTADVPFRGIDLREIPVESIERIEVIQGVASAEYSELTDGAIIIERKAGKSPLQFTTNINAGSTNFSLNKGFNLPKKWGGLTTDLNYALSNSNPRDKVQQYKRYGASIRWNTIQYKRVRNKLSLDFNTRVDDAKQDPDDASERKYYSKAKNFRVSNNTFIRLDSKIINDINLTLSYAEGTQESYAQWLLNQPYKGYTAKDTTGIYEGVLLNGQYLAVEEIIGNPISMSGNLKFSSRFKFGNTRHNLSYGLNSSYANNGGKGIVSDPDRPRFVDFNNQNIRPYSFEQTPSMVNSGLYFTDNVAYKIAGKQVHSNLGVRVDSQNGSLSVQPRLSTQVILNKQWNIAAAYGISSKSPTLAHRYPPPSWIDVPLILVVNSKASLYLVYTERFETANKDLKPSKSTQAEFTVNYRNSFLSSRVNAYFKDNRDGFNSLKQFVNFTLPNYSYSYDPTLNKIVYAENGTHTVYRDRGYLKVQNALNSYTYGVDWSISLNKINAINTSVSTSSSFILSEQNNDYYDIINLESPVNINGENIWYVLHPPVSNNKRYVFTSKLNTTTHIPKLGFVIMTNTDFFWMNKQKTKYTEDFQPALGYLDTDMRPVFFTGSERYGIPPRNVRSASTDQRIIYANFSVSVAKEISKRIRIAVTTYNTWNLHPQSSYTNPDTGAEVITTYNSPLSITGGISLKL